MSRFFANRTRAGQHKDVHQTVQREDVPDLALKHVLTSLTENRKRIWNSIELFHEYQEHGGNSLNRRELVDNLCCHFAGELLVLSSPGYANIVAFHNEAALLLKIVKQDDVDDIDNSIGKVAKQVIKDCKVIGLDKAKYRLDIDKVQAEEAVSSTLLTLLASISPKLHNTLPALMVGNIVTSVLKSQPTDLQIALGVLLRHSKMLLGYTYDFGITCSYDEVLCFKKSAAVSAMKDPIMQGISTSENGLVQTVVDNFDADIHSPNGKLSTHSLAMIMTQPSGMSNDEDKAEETIVRLKHVDMKVSINTNEEVITHYVGHKNPPMPEVPTSNLPSDFSRYQDISTARARELDFQFCKDIHEIQECPEYNGYNTQICREQGHTPKPKTQVVYLPLIDEAPADPATIMTSMLKAKALTERTDLTEFRLGRTAMFDANCWKLDANGF
ncbi:hypothetical protein KUCAC02_025425 [Chaenocephalus aceratus]|uniref:Uncharacterized protein n=1 Tax=Chaenocephalus aceratus TaxID=36190 RepID=A0ACB9VVL1_CHAAC|nr:hypothetical protein KUCAC02_025425 [Chaenocephalus aceratus]